jgi:mitogen-activated protein kinase organizer 1
VTGYEPDYGILMQNLPFALPIQVYRDGLTHPVGAVAVDDQSTTIVSGSEKTLIVHDVVTGQCKRRLHGHVGRINAVSVSDSAQVYVSASYDASVRLWDGRSRSYEPIQTLKDAKDSVSSVHCVQKDNLAVIRTASIDGVVRCYDLRMGLLQCNDVGDPITGMCTAMGDDQCVLVNCLDGAMRLLDLEKGNVVQHYVDGHTAGQYSLDCSISATDDYVATGSENGDAVLYDISKGRVCQVLEGHRQPTCSVAMHPKADRASVVVTASYDGTAVVWGHDGGHLMQW